MLKKVTINFYVSIIFKLFINVSHLKEKQNIIQNGKKCITNKYHLNFFLIITIIFLSLQI